MYWKLFSLNPWKISRKLPITERGYRTLQMQLYLNHSLRCGYSCLNTPGISTFILKEHLRMGPDATYTCFMCYDSAFQNTKKYIFSTWLNMFSPKNPLLDIWLGTEYSSGKKTFNVSTFLNPLIKFATLLKEIQKWPAWVPNFMKIGAHFNFGTTFALIYNFGSRSWIPSTIFITGMLHLL